MLFHKKIGLFKKKKKKKKGQHVFFVFLRNMLEWIFHSKINNMDLENRWTSAECFSNCLYFGGYTLWFQIALW